MSGASAIQVDDSRVVVALGKYRLSLQQNDELMFQIGAAMLVSVRRTFREQGSPAGSWAPLAPSTIRSNPKKYGAGHKLLVDKGNLLGSIHAESQAGSVTIGTNLKYAAVHQFGSRDRGGVGFGPRTKAMQDATVNVGEHTRLQSQFSGNRWRQQGPGYESTRLEGPVLEGKRRLTIRNRRSGPANLIKERLNRIGPRNRTSVAAHTRHQNIPARPYLVFRPEDPRRIQALVTGFVNRAKAAAGLEGAQ
jgi:phage virion morphogenesis protein